MRNAYYSSGRLRSTRRLASSTTHRNKLRPAPKSSDAALSVIQWEDYKDQFKIRKSNIGGTWFCAPSTNFFSTLEFSSISVNINQLKTSSPLTDLSTWLTKIPKGFENFFPKQKQDTDVSTSSDPESSSSNNKKSSETSTNKNINIDPQNATFKTKDGNESKDKKKRQRKYSGIPPPDDNDPQNIPAMIALLLIISAANSYFKSNDVDNEGGRNGREITFIDFRNQLLDSGQVDKIVVVNNNLARVILHPGSNGIPQSGHTTSSSSFLGNTIQGSSLSDPSQNDGHGADKTILDFSKSSSMNTTVESVSSVSDTVASANKAPVYHFYIGSVESFEDKLSKAQSQVHPREWVPVQYVNEVNLLQEFIKASPMLALGAILLYFSRGLMGGGAAGGAGGGAGGGMGGIFQVGK